MDLELPLIFAKGFPASLNSLSEVQLHCFLKYLWEFTKVPHASQIFPEENLRPQERKRLLRNAVENVYNRLGCSYLLNFSEGIAQCNHTSLLFNVDSQLGVVYIWNKRYGKIIAKIPQSNLTYDLNLDISESNSPKKNEKQTTRKILEECKAQQTVEVKAKNHRNSSTICNNVITIESDPEIFEISDEDEPPDHSHPLSLPNSEVANVIEIVEDDDTQVKQIQTEQVSDIRCEKVWTVSRYLETIEVSDSEDEECHHRKSTKEDRSEDALSRLLISHHSKGQQSSTHGKRKKSIPKRYIDPDPPPVTIQPTPLPDKPTFLYYFGLCEPSNTPDDPIILPELKKCDFVKFHRLPLNTVPFLANHGLIDKKALNPGPPGQNSKFVTMVDNINEERRRNTPRTAKLAVSRYKSMDMENARDYTYPTKTYRTRLPAPLPKRRRKPTGLDRPRNNGIKPPTPTLRTSTPQQKVKLKECFIRIQKLNPFVFRKYFVQRKSK